MTWKKCENDSSRTTEFFIGFVERMSKLCPSSTARNDCLEPRLDEMTLIVCPQCNVEFEDDVLCCPHCGTAQIPQLSKAQLRLEQMKAAHGPLAAIYIGLALGFLVGGAFFVITLLNNTADLASGLAALMCGMIGSAGGLMYHRFFLSRPARGRERKPGTSAAENTPS